MRNAGIASLVILGSSLSVVACGGSSASSGAPPVLDEGADVAQDESDLTAAKVTLRVPLLDQHGKLLSQHNAALVAAKLGTFPDTVEIVANAKGVLGKGATKAWDDARALAGKAEKLNIEIDMLMFAEPMEYQTKNPKTSICYRGNPLFVVDVVASLTDAVFSDQLSIQGWRYRNKKVLGENLSAADEATFPSIWKNWRGKGAAILTLTASSDDGNETNVGLIYKCS